jgi:tetratricopeptide (TPR) repeat protein
MITLALDRVNRDRRSARAWGRLGMVLLVHRLQHEAVVCLTQAEQFDPHEPRWSYFLALAVEDPEKSLPPLRRAVERAAVSDPLNSAPRLRLAEVLLQLGQEEEARQELQTVQKEEPDNSRAAFGLALVALARGEERPAEEHLNRAARSPDCRRKAYAQLAQLAGRQGRAEAAEFSRRANLPPKDRPWKDPYLEECRPFDHGAESLFQQAQQREASGDEREGVAAYRELTDTLPGARSYLALGAALARAGDRVGAEAAFRKALTQPDLRVAAQFCLGAFLIEEAQRLAKLPEQQAQARERALEASEHLRQAIQLKPDHALAHVKRGEVLRLLGRRQEAIRSFRAGLECRPELAEGHLLLGETLAEDGQGEAARQSLEEAERLAAPGDRRARQLLDRLGVQLRIRPETKPSS